MELVPEPVFLLHVIRHVFQEHIIQEDSVESFFKLFQSKFRKKRSCLTREGFRFEEVTEFLYRFGRLAFFNFHGICGSEVPNGL